MKICLIVGNANGITLYSGTSENRLPLFIRKPPQCGQESTVPNYSLYYSVHVQYQETSVLIGVLHRATPARSMAGRKKAFQNNPELQRFVLHRVRPTGRQLGVGSYGSVEELEVNGLLCAGKRLHEALLEQGNVGVENIARKYLLECQVMTEIRHPHVVQFLGLCFLEVSGLPVLVMERLDSSLDDLLETSPSLPFALKQSLLADVARGLLYLHTRNPPIVHRDLSARNVLLTSSLVAKISDLGNARIVDLQSGQLARTLTRLPGTLSYMPPESFDGGSQYGPRLDIFSFGHLALFTLTQVFPGNLLPPNYPDPDNSGRLVGVSEVERRTDYIEPLYKELGEQHPLVQLVCQCLHNVPAQRPSAEELLQQLEAQMKEAYGRKLVRAEMARLQVAMMTMLRTEETDAREKDNEIKHLQHDLQQVQEDRQGLQIKVEEKDTQLQQKDEQISRQQRELQALREDSGRLQAEVETKDAEIDRQQGQLETLKEDKGRLQAKVEAGLGQVQEKDAEINRLQGELQALRAEMDAKIAQFQKQLHGRDGEINKLEGELKTLRAEMDARSAQLQQELKERDAEINRLETEQRVQTTSGDKSEHVPAMQRPPQKPQLPIQLGWYFGNIKQADAEKLLLQTGNPTGTFLIGDSQCDYYQYFLAVRYNDRVVCYRIKKADTGGYCIAQRCMCHSLEELVGHYSVDADGLCCRLTVVCPKFEKLKDEWEIERSSIQITKQLQAGEFGKMWEGIWNGTKPVTVKTPISRSMGMQEVRIMKKLGHEHIIQLYAVCTESEPMYIVTEFMKNGILLDYLRKGEGQHMKLPELIDIAAQVASGMAYLEAQHLIHRNLAAQNILIGEGNIVKIANFRMAGVIIDGEYIPELGEKLRIKSTAPEAVLYDHFSIKSDVWSYGIFLWELITYGQMPYQGMKHAEVQLKLKQGYRLPQPFGCPDALYQVMINCWKDKPEERPTFEFLKYHMEDFFTSAGCR